MLNKNNRLSQLGYTLICHVGNSNTIFALFAGERFYGKWRLQTAAGRTADEYMFFLQNILQNQNIMPEHVTSMCISTVVSHVETHLTSMARRYLNVEPLHIVPGIKTGMQIHYGRAGDLGPDRLANIIAINNTYKKNAIVVDFGRITSFDVIGEEGEYLGGIVAPGVNLALETMARVAPRLPDVGHMKPKRVVGNTIVESMQSGSFWGAVDMVSGILQRVKQEIAAEIETNYTIVATGGLSRDIVEATDVFDAVDTDLTFKGLKILLDRNVRH